MSILHIDLAEGTFATADDLPESGLELGLRLFKEHGSSSIVITASVKESLKYPGSATFVVVFHSPITDRLEFQYSNLPPGFSLYKMGYQALVITGRATRLSYISLYSSSKELLPCDYLRGQSARHFEEIALKNINDTALATGRAADNSVRFASVLCKDRQIPGAGLGFVFSSMNLKGIAFQGYIRKDDLANDKETMRFARKIEESRFARRIRKGGANCFVDDAQRLGWLPVMNLSRRFDPRAYALNADSFSEIYGNFPDSCQECFLACGRRKKDNDALPSWQECMALGSNIGFFDPRTVARLVDVAHEEGLDIRHLGGVLGYISSINPTDLEVISLSKHTEEEYLHLIHAIGESRGTGAIFREGLKGFPEALQTKHGGAIGYDLRGTFPEAIMASLCLDIVLPASLFLPKRQLGVEASAIIAFYELCYTLALLCYGYAPVVTTSIYWDKIPRLAFRVPSLLRYFCWRFSVYGMKSKTLLEKGLKIMEELDLSFERIPEFFEMNPDSAKDTATVPLIRLQELFLSEKARTERVLKSNSDMISRPKAENKPAVAPQEERGLDGEPGLIR